MNFHAFWWEVVIYVRHHERHHHRHHGHKKLTHVTGRLVVAP